jgi:hypothetical protein
MRPTTRPIETTQYSITQQPGIKSRNCKREPERPETPPKPNEPKVRPREGVG